MNAVITGASKGLGKATAQELAKLGYNLFLCSRNEMVLYKTVEALYNEFPGIEIKGIPADLGTREGCDAFAAKLLAAGAAIDVLVNNAGQFEPGSVHNEDAGTLEHMLNVNLFSAYHVTRALLPGMMERKSGHIINMCSIASLQAYANGGSYSISKFALLGFGKNLREEMKPHHIKVTNIMPGAAYTDSWAGSGVDPNRLMEAADVAKAIGMLVQLSPQACVEDIVLRPQLGDL